LARYDGIKYGRSKVKEKIKNLIEVYFKTRQQYLGEEPRRRILLGSFALSSGYYEAYYLRAQKVRTLIGKDFERAFKKVDLILTPTSPTPAFKIGEKQDPLAMYLSDIFLVAVNLAGLPAISLPVSKEGLPIGVQFIAPPFLESRLFKIGKILEKI
jgi:aspartyl-tRNA(Asn)/glutamyl-tRNA(Gln) amidotransferase subunit A